MGKSYDAPGAGLIVRPPPPGRRVWESKATRAAAATSLRVLTLRLQHDLLRDVLLRGARVSRLTLLGVRFRCPTCEDIYPVVAPEHGREDQSHHCHDSDAPMSGALHVVLPLRVRRRDRARQAPAGLATRYVAVHRKAHQVAESLNSGKAAAVLGCRRRARQPYPFRPADVSAGGSDRQGSGR